MAKSWLSSYAANLAEKQPDKEELHLPSCLTKLCIFEKYKEEMGAANEDTIEISRFREMWMEHFPHLKINKVFIPKFDLYLLLLARFSTKSQTSATVISCHSFSSVVHTLSKFTWCTQHKLKYLYIDREPW